MMTILFVCLFVLLCYGPVNSYGHGGRSVHLTTLFPGKLEQAINQLFVHTPGISFVTDSNTS